MQEQPARQFLASGLRLVVVVEVALAVGGLVVIVVGVDVVAAVVVVDNVDVVALVVSPRTPSIELDLAQPEDCREPTRAKSNK